MLSTNCCKLARELSRELSPQSSPLIFLVLIAPSPPLLLVPRLSSTSGWTSSGSRSYFIGQPWISLHVTSDRWSYFPCNEHVHSIGRLSCRTNGTAFWRTISLTLPLTLLRRKRCDPRTLPIVSPSELDFNRLDIFRLSFVIFCLLAGWHSHNEGWRQETLDTRSE